MREVVAICIAALGPVLAVAGMPLPFEVSMALSFEPTATALSVSEQQRFHSFLRAMASRGQCEVRMVDVESHENENDRATHIRDSLRREGIANVRLVPQLAQAAGEVRITFWGNYGQRGCSVY
jgi:hypothetical protein